VTPGYSFRDTAPIVEREEPVDAHKESDEEGIGTTNAGYAKPDEGPFECENCEHYHAINGTHGTCDHSAVTSDAEAGEIKLQGEHALVAARGCCNFYRRTD
jgi:hypothetical protein